MKLKKKANTVRIPPLKRAIKVNRKSSDIEGESAVSKALKNVRKVFEKKTVESTNEEPKLPIKSYRTKKTKQRLRKKQVYPRGIVYVGHIPHGFYEEQMTDYFKQFGKVTRVRVARSKNTGKSRGYGYIEFMHPEVAKIAAETMHNYLMCGRLLKATYIPPERQHPRYFAGKPWTEKVYPKKENRNAVNKVRNANPKKQEHARFVQSTRDKLSALEKKLKEKGFDLKFVPASDVKA
ncbi:PREDICTED: MKI67 FHA domain-interacting nucleolar phosphoprotein-like [Dufourea novaeangliae]|uniref:MKI67 FHA domain-interacting nucleolar phosphoprotein-like n=1 Tax=Dufourea novaeangliae TaxID=178035 RepID=A0A154PM34_DUFNO|nr:PREDICTED: MKI67 FHA domain-interacting nucleolar phosphoprotein-like [Dufourea novaeangliae]KZC12338.1 MKI67 FHA domain-interacting nucleolar phosphoprotein-like [Dufourea novaeangliae]